MKREILVVLLLAVTILSGCSGKKNNIDGNLVSVNEKGSDDTVIKHKTVYGINVDSLKADTGYVKKNEFLADILLRHSVRYSVIDKIAKDYKKVFDVRKIRVGNRYVIISANDSVETPNYFIYEINRSEFVVFHLNDTVYAYIDEKDFEYRQHAISGVIKSSLWNAIKDAGENPYLANDLSEIYAWTIDFFGVQKGDKFKVIYDKLYIEGKPAGIARVKASVFHHSGYDYYAFYFVQNGDGSYYDETGGSMERAFLKAPLKYTRISSRFSNSRYHPVLKIRRPHHGVDYAAPEGTPVHAVGDGVIIKKGYQKRGGGNYLKIKHNSVYTTSYMHMRAFAKGMRVGKHVKQGELIGYVGHTGLATGPHLDFRFYKNGKAVNPLKVKSPPTKPVNKENMPAFNSLVNYYKQLLDNMKY